MAASASASDYSEDFEDEGASERSTRAGQRGGRRRHEMPAEDKQEVNGSGGELRPSQKPSIAKNKLKVAEKKSKPTRRAASKPALTTRPPAPAPASKSVGGSPLRDHQLSAKDRAIHYFQNRLSEQAKLIDQLGKENRLLNRLQKKQEKEWSKIQQQEDELPHILQRHSEEVRVLRKQLRRSQEEAAVSHQKVRELQGQIRKSSEQNRKLNKLVRTKNLMEREMLTVQLDHTRESLGEMTRKVAELERGLEASSKNHAQEVRGLKHRNRVLATETETLRNTTSKLQQLLKEKSKEMDIMNIYTQRIRNAGKTQLNASPLVDTSDAVEVPAINNQASQTALSCPPSKDVCLHEKSELKMASSQTESVGKDVSEVAKCVNVSTQTKELSLLPLAKTGAATAAKAEKGKSKVPSQVAHTQNPKCTPSSVQQPQDLAESSGNGREIDAEKSKQKLIQKLRELDSQKAAPGSKPVPNVKSSGSLPSNVTSASQAFPTQHVHISGVPANMDAKLLPNTATNSNYLQQSNAADNTLQQNAVAQEKKQLLLAKLMAIDEGSDPSHMSSSARGAQKQPSTGSTNDSSSSSTMKQPSAESKTVGEDKNKVGSSLSSLGSWPEVVENMHHGRPAHARESDPFGSKFHQSRKTLGKGKSGPSSSGEKGNFGTRLRSSETNEHQSDGNKLRSQEQVAGSSSVQKVDMKRDSSSTNLRQTQREMASFGYTTSNSNVSVSHSRSGGTAELFSSPSSEIRKTTRFDHFPSWQAHDQPQMQPVFGEGSAIAPTLSENSLLPRRMKAKPAAVTGHDVMPGAISYVSEPDDLEEIVL